jgi:thiamine biosynthesis protein ThiC
VSAAPDLGTYVIRRRSGWSSAEELQLAGARSADVADSEMPDDIRWIRSYVVMEPDGNVGTVCIYQASSAAKIREHAARVGMPADEIHEISDTVLVRPDPAPLTA